MRRAALLALPTLVAVAVSCGSRSPLDDGTLPGNSSSTGATGGSGSVIDAGPDAPPPAPPCKLVSAGDSVKVFTVIDKLLAPSAVAIGPSDVALQTLVAGAYNVKIARFSVGATWPGDMVKTKGLEVFAPQSVGPANLVASPDGAGVALTWFGDSSGGARPQFQRWDVASWSAGAPVDLAPGGKAIVATAAGAGVGASGVGYAGQGYGVVWHDVDSTPLAAVLDAAGKVVLGPHAVAAPTGEPLPPYPSIVWSGESYLMASAFTSCAPGDALCSPFSVVISRVRPAGGDLVDDSGVEVVTTLPAQAGPGQQAGRPALAHHAGRSYVAWSEGDSLNPGELRRVLVAELSPSGEVVSGPVVLENEEAPLQSRVTLVASDLGVSLTWIENVPGISVGDKGASLVVTTLLSSELEELSHRVTVPSTRWESFQGPPTATALATPKSLLLVWAAPNLDSNATYSSRVWAARLDCVE